MSIHGQERSDIQHEGTSESQENLPYRQISSVPAPESKIPYDTSAGLHDPAGCSHFPCKIPHSYLPFHSSITCTVHATNRAPGGCEWQCGGRHSL